MGTISNCLNIVSHLDDLDVNDVLDRADAYKSHGIDQAEAHARAVDDVIAQVKGDKSDMLKLIHEQHPQFVEKSTPQTGKAPKDKGGRSAHPSAVELLRTIKEKFGSIHTSEAEEITGEKGFKANSQNPGMFSSKGRGLDDLVTFLVERHWLPESALTDAAGYYNETRELLRDALDGKEIYHPDSNHTEDRISREYDNHVWSMENDPEYRAAAVEQANRELGVTDVELTNEELAAIYSPNAEEGFGAQGKEAADVPASAEGKGYEPGADRNDAAGGHEPQQTSAVEERATDRPGRQPVGEQGDSGFLQSHTADDLRHRDERVETAEALLKKERAAADAKVKADAEASDFTLTGSDRKADANPNQGDLLDGAKDVQDGQVLGRVGVTPKNSRNITIRDGIIFIDGEEAISYETGDPVQASGRTLEAVKKDLIEHGVLSSREKVFSPSKDTFPTADGGDTIDMGLGIPFKVKDVVAAMQGVFGKSNRTSDDARHAFSDMLSAFKNSGNETVAERFQKILSGIVSGEAAGVRAIGEIRKSKAIEKLWRHFNDFGGMQGAQDTVFETASRTHANRRIDTVSRALEPFADNQNALRTIVKLVENRGTIRAGTPIHDAAATIARELDAEWQVMKAAGVDVGPRQDYFPRSYDVFKIAREQQKFIAAATRAYVIDGMSQQDAQAKASSWLAESIAQGNGVPEVPFSTIGNAKQPSANFAKERTISNEAYRKSGLSEFAHSNPQETLAGYFRRTAIRTEFERRFGGQGVNAKGEKTKTLKWDALMKELEDEGNGDLVGWAHDHANGMMGISRANTSAPVRAGISLAQGLAVATLLKRAVISSLTEPLAAYNKIAPSMGQAAGAKAAAGMYAYGALDLALQFDSVKSIASHLGMDKLVLSHEHDRILSDALGATVSEAAHAVTTSMRWGDFSYDTPNGSGRSAAVSNFSHKLSKAAMMATGLEAWTNSNKVFAAVKMGQHFVNAMLTDGHTPMGAYELTKLGIAKADIPAVKQYAARNPSITQALADAEAGNKYAAKYRDAIVRFQGHVVMSENVSDKPWLQRHPLAKPFFALQGWLNNFWTHVQKPAFLNAIEGFHATAGTGKGKVQGLTKAQGASMMATPVIYAAAMTALANYAVTFLKDHWSGKSRNVEFQQQQDEETWGGVPKKVLRVASQSNWLGQADPLFNTLTAGRYSGDPLGKAYGPIIGNMARAINEYTKNEDSANSKAGQNAQSRRMWGAIYTGFVEPALSSAAAMSPAGAGFATFLSGRDELRRHFVNALAGESEPAAMRDTKAAAKRYEETGDPKDAKLAALAPLASDMDSSIRSARAEGDTESADELMKGFLEEYKKATGKGTLLNPM